MGGHTQANTSIYRIAASGGTPELVVNAAPDQVFALWYGMALPADGNSIVFTLDYASPDNNTVYIASRSNRGVLLTLPK